MPHSVVIMTLEFIVVNLVAESLQCFDAVGWAVGCWHGYQSVARCKFAYGPDVSCFSKIQIGSGTGSPAYSQTKYRWP